jgi:hypothetical protein
MQSSVEIEGSVVIASRSNAFNNYRDVGVNLEATVIAWVAEQLGNIW